MINLTLYYLVPKDRSNRVRWLLLDTFDTKIRFSPERGTDLWPSFLQWFFWGLTTFENAAFAFVDNQGEKERATIKRFIAPLDHMLATNDYLVGGLFTAADIVCAYDLGVLSGAYDLKAHPSVHAYLSRLLARPAAKSFAEAIGWP